MHTTLNRHSLIIVHRLPYEAGGNIQQWGGTALDVRFVVGKVGCDGARCVGLLFLLVPFPRVLGRVVGARHWGIGVGHWGRVVGARHWGIGALG